MSLFDLQKLSLFRHLSRPELEQIAEHLSVESHPPGWILFREGTTGRVLYVVKSGRIQIVKNLGMSSEMQLDTMGPDSIFGEISLFLEAPRSASAVVASSGDAEVVCITSVILDNILRHHPAPGSKILRMLLERSLRRTLDLDRRILHLEQQMKSVQGMK